MLKRVYYTELYTHTCKASPNNLNRFYNECVSGSRKVIWNVRLLEH